ncbi:DNA replication/repair protein RecF [Halodurantibacterium flavum]|uniref:DNA replication and repair protein RecF n=1 Tax=Halodurantibacterium flavum TaxID=1382802 RepID=A0ABW4S7Y1_9RHOB
MTLALEALTLSHFRSHRLARLTFGQRVITIHGPNGAGKTNLLEAVSLLSPGRGLRGAAAEDLMRRPERLGWKIRAQLQAPAAEHLVETWAEPGSGRQVAIDEKPATQVMLGRLVRVLWLVPAMDRLWTESAEGRRRFLDRITLSFFPDHAEAALSYDKAMRERNRLLRDQVADARWYGALEEQMAQAGASLMQHRRDALARLEAAQAGAETAFPAALLRIEGAEPFPETADAMAASFAEGRRRDMAAGRSLTGPHRVDLGAIYAAKDMPAASCSTGEQKALLISLILANARALKQETGAAPVLLLDEIAAHLDAARRSALYAEILGLGAQAFLTGTGAELFAELEGQAQSFEVTEAGGSSTVTERTMP